MKQSTQLKNQLKNCKLSRQVEKRFDDKCRKRLPNADGFYGFPIIGSPISNGFKQFLAKEILQAQLELLDELKEEAYNNNKMTKNETIAQFWNMANRWISIFKQENYKNEKR